MSTLFTLVVNDARDAATVRSEILPEFAALTNTAIAVNQGDAWAACDHIGRYFQKATVGSISVNITVQSGEVAASGTATFSTVVAGNSVTIGGVTFTGNNAPSGNQFLTGSTDTLSAASLATVVNANATTNKLVRATSSGAVVTFTAIVPGPVGNFITLTAVGVPITVSGAVLAGGTVSASVVISEGL